MSTHILDVSGQRALTVTVNDPARTAAQCSAKAGDDVAAMLGGLREIRMTLPPNARVQRREYIRSTPKKDEAGAYVKDEAGDYVYDETPYEELVLVVPGSVSIFGRGSNLPEDAAPEGETQEPKPHEGTPHTSLVVKRSSDLHFTESGELLEELELRETIDRAFGRSSENA